MLYAIVAVIILILDQATKYWTNFHLAEGATAPFIPGFIQLTNVHNTGAAFSFLEGGRWFFVILTLVVTIGVIILLSKNIVKGKLGRWMLIMVVAGGLGNCIDRALYGYVVDMFQFQFKIFGGDFAIFNVSDIFITVCGIIFCVYLIFHKEPLEEKPVPSRVPTRTMSSERPVRADYITQLKKPVVEGRRNIEAELAAKTAEAALARNPEGVITDWNMPDFASEKAPVVKTAPEPKKDYSEFFKSEPEIKPEAKPEPILDKIKDEPLKPAKNNNSDFSIEDIIAEFKDK
ncbi:MAG: signal peptidase II [Firmicutes bacterium HGW-Firmicutes-16]|nr:MAG: signal peptidase II [Firmicutes bacterium HGW-Firmicutes-16]